ncbi:MAG TPA: anthranilate phosphoribosyltransferase [Polyangiaceae bacterium]|nr:anthranilate phosphoribosyltransferase [Polyangiaceae bacterium]
MSTEPILFREVFREIARAEGPTPATVRAAFDAILVGAWSPPQIAGFVIALRVRGETPEIIAAAASAMRSAMVVVDHGLAQTLDTCGTGGDGLGTLNVSTAAAIVVASLGVAVAKHGNRAGSGKTGAADVLEALGVPLDVPPEKQAGVLRDAGIAFLFAQMHHPAMKHAGPVRRELAGVPTIFNILGPLANPARATHQLVGTFDDGLRPMMAAALRSLGTRRAWVVRGEDGLDEVSPTGPTRVTELDGESLRERAVAPEDFGLPRLPLSAIAGGDAPSNAAAIEAILRGDPHPARGAIVLNAAAALVVARGVEPKAAAIDADQAIASGRAAATLQKWKTLALGARLS